MGESGAPFGLLGGQFLSYVQELQDRIERTSMSLAKNIGAYLGTAIFPVTSPVSVEATLTMLSVPAVYR